MRERIDGLTATILEIVDETNYNVSVSEVYFKVKQRLTISDEQSEITYNNPNYYNSIRKILSVLVAEGKIIRVHRGIYHRIGKA